jgi:hypothetical protein
MSTCSVNTLFGRLETQQYEHRGLVDNNRQHLGSHTVPLTPNTVIKSFTNRPQSRQACTGIQETTAFYIHSMAFSCSLTVLLFGAT